MSMCRQRLPPVVGQSFWPYHHWFGRPDKLRTDPYYELSLSLAQLRALMLFKMGSHSLPIEQGRFVRPQCLQHLRRCVLCNALAVDDELHYLFDCPQLESNRCQYACLFDDAGPCDRQSGTKTNRLSAIC